MLWFGNAQITSVELNRNSSYTVSCQRHLINMSLRPVFFCVKCVGVFFFIRLCETLHAPRNLLVKSQGTTRSAFLAADSPVSQSRGRALKRRLCQRSVQRHFIRPAQTARLLGSAASRNEKPCITWRRQPSLRLLVGGPLVGGASKAATFFLQGTHPILHTQI